MRDLPRDLRPPADVARKRVAKSEHPERFLAVLGQTAAALESGADLATAAWTSEDPTRLAAEIEALAADRRLNSFRKDPA
ncbi:hypothetical protein HUT18_11950 [Streptomyces sp. NA04227]|uniref:hypothetical protein n=1 Tax=Streptomyces sp. NA04227 TaxID=2742136 RepID=UPI0015919D00|nr:hypothetical protein [Streptomyces sp. NA04227]QKW07011.1 hypothetical protein HUT18_11950 [Streptomyces sp. NA04227]